MTTITTAASIAVQEAAVNLEEESLPVDPSELSLGLSTEGEDSLVGVPSGPLGLDGVGTVGFEGLSPGVEGDSTVGVPGSEADGGGRAETASQAASDSSTADSGGR